MSSEYPLYRDIYGETWQDRNGRPVMLWGGPESTYTNDNFEIKPGDPIFTIYDYMEPEKAWKKVRSENGPLKPIA